MYTKKAFTSPWPVLGAAIVACTLFAGAAAPKDQDFAVAYHVSKRGLDLSQPAGARELYARIQHAAEVVCTHGMRVDLVPVADQKACYDKSLGDAVRAADTKLVTQVYLASHTAEQAAAFGIAPTLQIATK